MTLSSWWCMIIVILQYTVIVTTITVRGNTEDFTCGKAFEEPVFTYEDPDLLSQNGTIGGEIMNDFPFNYGNPTNGQAAYIRPDAVRCSPNTTYYKKIEPANPHSYPWHVALAKRGIVLCSGTLIGRSWILTSGNCQMRKTVVYAGVANLLQFRGQNVQMRNVVWSESQRHPWSILSKSRQVKNGTRETQYKKLDHNLILLKVDRPFDVTAFVRPICLPEAKLKLKPGLKCVTTGWGWTKMTSLLQQQIATILPYSECAQHKVYGRSKSPERFCVSNGCTCLENGMPFFCKIGNKLEHKYYLTGVKVADGKVTTRKLGVSVFNMKKNSKCGNIPRFYIPIAPYLGWINAVISGKNMDVWSRRNTAPEYTNGRPKNVGKNDPVQPPVTDFPQTHRYLHGFRPSSIQTTRKPMTHRQMTTPLMANWADRKILDIIADIHEQQAKIEAGCIKRNDPKGLRYRGGVSTTKYGFPCLAWNTTEKYRSRDYPNAGLEQNYCRNPDNDSRGPWCFFYGPRKKRTLYGHCKINSCP